MKTIKIIVEKHPDGYVAYPPGLRGVVVAEERTYEEALAEVTAPPPLVGGILGCYP